MAMSKIRTGEKELWLAQVNHEYARIEHEEPGDRLKDTSRRNSTPRTAYPIRFV